MIDLPQKLRLWVASFCFKQSLLPRQHRAKAKSRRFYPLLTEKLLQSEIGTSEAHRRHLGGVSLHSNFQCDVLAQRFIAAVAGGFDADLDGIGAFLGLFLNGDGSSRFGDAELA